MLKTRSCRSASGGCFRPNLHRLVACHIAGATASMHRNGHCVAKYRDLEARIIKQGGHFFGSQSSALQTSLASMGNGHNQHEGCGLQSLSSVRL